jgi:hypothetical protein
LFGTAATAGVLLFLLTGAVPQDPAYHRFADTGALAGVPNFWNVLSNLPFLIVGIAGIARCRMSVARGSGLAPEYGVFFCGVALTAFGSAYYHLAPANATLVWDRLPMTVAFAGLVGLLTGLYVSHRLAHTLTIAWLVLGVLSVTYWAATEARGAGDLRPYAFVQFAPLVVLPFLLLDPRRNLVTNRYLWLLVAAYGAAKFAEHFDREIFALAPLSGHSLKHLLAALGAAALIPAVTRTPARESLPSG